MVSGLKNKSLILVENLVIGHHFGKWQMSFKRAKHSLLLEKKSFPNIYSYFLNLCCTGFYIF